VAEKEKEEDTDLDDQDEVIEESKRNSVSKNCCLIYPDATMRAVWDISLFTCIIY
jgi:hypothetical protein